MKLGFYESTTLIIQLLLLIAGIGAVLVYWYQLHAMRRSLQHSLIMQRRELYTGMTTSLTEDEVKTMLLHIGDHFNREIYREHYAGNGRRIRSYLLMKRKYLYLVISTSFVTEKDDPARVAPHIWLDELIKFREFHDVHRSQGHYYPLFATLVNRRMQSANMKHLEWAADVGLSTSEVAAQASDSPEPAKF